MKDLTTLYPSINPNLIEFMSPATHCEPNHHPNNWNWLRDQAKEEFTQEEINALDGSGIINKIFKS